MEMPPEVGSRIRLFPAGMKRSGWLVLLLLMVAASSVLCAANPPQESRSPVLGQAESLLASNRPQQAVDVLKAHLQGHPGDLPARLLLADALFFAGRADLAEEQYRQILKSRPNYYLAFAGLGEMYLRMNRPEDAEPMLAKAVKLSNSEPELKIEWAEALARLHRFQEASAALGGVPLPQSKSARISFFRLKAAVAEGLGEHAMAATWMERALALDPEDTSLQLGTAAAELQAGNWSKAAGLAQPVFSRTQNPGAGLLLLQAQLLGHENPSQTLASLRSLSLSKEQDLSLRQRIAELLISQGLFAEAVPDMSAAVEMEPTRPDLLFNLALAQFKAGQPKDALASAERSKSLKDSAETEQLIADIQESQGNNLAAVKSYQAAVELAPGDEKYQLALAMEFIVHSNFEPAKLVLEEAAQTHPKSWRIQLALGMVEYFHGTKQEASKILLHAAELAPAPEIVLGYLAEVELAEVSVPDPAAVARICDFANKHSGAARHEMYCATLQFRTDYALRDKSRVTGIARRLELASKALPEEAQPHCELGKLYRWTEEWVLALRESEVCVKMDPSSAEAHYRLAQIYQHKGDSESAEREMNLYQKAADRVADANAKREQSVKTFVYSIQKGAAEQH